MLTINFCDVHHGVVDIIGEEYILRGMIPIALVNLCIRHRIGGIG